MEQDTANRGFGHYFRRFAECNYYLARFHYQWLLGREQQKYPKPPVLIFQMGKVGSSTIVRSLNALNLDRPVYHSHLLSWSRIKKTESQRKKLFLTERYSHLKRPWLNRFIRRQIDRGLKKENWKIISLVREPIKRNVSTFFENLKVKPLKENGSYQISSDYYGFGPLTVNIQNLNELRGIFFKNLRHDTVIDFFDREFKGAFNFDVFEHPFNKSEGYDIYPGDHFDVLLIRLEDLNKVAEKAFESFLGIKSFSLVSSNIGRQKTYASIYEKFKEEVMFSKSYLDRYYHSKFMTHFYSDEEIAKMRGTWKCSDQGPGPS